MDKSTLNLLSELAPDLMEKMMLRAMVIERISALQPVGRRALAQRLHLPEREIRSVCDSLKEDGLLSVAASGMTLTGKADELLPGAREMTHSRSALKQLEQHLSRNLNVSRVRIVPGNADENPGVLTELGRVAAENLIRLLAPGMILTVSGGMTVAAVAQSMHAALPIDVRVLPARGGLGMAVETQAGTLAAQFAQALGGTYSLVHLPDAVPAETLRELMKLPEIGEPLRALHQTDVLLYGVGRADTSARASSLPGAEADMILRLGAIGEAVGCYFDHLGRQVYQTTGVGLTGEQIAHLRCTAAVAAGASKADAIAAVLRHHHHELLVIDESAALALDAMA